MKFNLISLLLAFCFLINAMSCGKPPCKCDFDQVQFLEVKFINQQGQNLVFGQTALFQLDSICVLKQKNNFDYHNASVRKGLIDSNNVRFDFYVREETSYIYYKQQVPQDSLNIKWLAKKGKCCGSEQEYFVVDSVTFDGALIKPRNGVYYFIK